MRTARQPTTVHMNTYMIKAERKTKRETDREKERESKRAPTM